ncbi:hypothetical protein ACEWY4_014204 [Coilia grayii]|uniref:Collectrin-like domain-containing protein n=1 Tax=Coilia grayii TaxID=363190 RepID=A0ABD1JRL8_9TELE
MSSAQIRLGTHFCFQYAWNENELYLFKAAVAYAMRQYYFTENGQQVNFTPENVETCNVTERVSFFFRVTDPKAAASIIPKADVEAAIRLSRGHINSAFLLSNDTLEFVGILSTLAPPIEPPVQVWLIVFGVVMGFVACVGVSSHRQRVSGQEEKIKKG